MTLDQIRAKREEAETAIRNILEGLRQETGLCPMDVHVMVARSQLIGESRETLRLSGLHIELEPI